MADDFPFPSRVICLNVVRSDGTRYPGPTLICAPRWRPYWLCKAWRLLRVRLIGVRRHVLDRICKACCK